MDDAAARALVEELFAPVQALYAERGLFQGTIGFGTRPAVVVVDFAYGWTDPAYPEGSPRLEAPVERTAALLAVARRRSVPVAFATLADLPDADQVSFKDARAGAGRFRPFDDRAREIDARLAPGPGEMILPKDAASAFFGTPLGPRLIQQGVDTVLICGCSTSACVRATAMDAMALRFRPVLVADCCGDRSALLHHFTLADMAARFARVADAREVIAWLGGLP